MVVGIDISKLTFDVTLLLVNGKGNHKVFANNQEGFKKLETWLRSFDAKDARICLEATGSYGEKISLFLHNLGYKVSVVNPTRIKAYARSESARIKTDKVDSAVIARFCKAQSPSLWAPPSHEEQQLRDLYRCLQNLIEDRTKFSNRMENLDQSKSSYKVWEEMVTTIERKIKEVEGQIKTLLRDNENFGKKVTLLESIPGISQKTAVAILSELPDVKIFESAREAAAFAGLTPSIRQSGTTVKGRGSLSKVGNAQLRKALFMPTLVAKKHNPIIEKFCDKLTKKGKAKMVVVAAGMRKLLHIIFGVLKNNQPFSCP